MGSGSVTALIGTGEPRLGLAQLVLADEAFAEFECGFGRFGSRGRPGIDQGPRRSCEDAPIFLTGAPGTCRLELVSRIVEPPSDLIEFTLLFTREVPERGTLAAKREPHKRCP